MPDIHGATWWLISEIDNGFLVEKEVVLRGETEPRRLLYYCSTMKGITDFLAERVVKQKKRRKPRGKT